jgi:cytochrome c oxidase subunit IV
MIQQMAIGFEIILKPVSFMNFLIFLVFWEKYNLFSKLAIFQTVQSFTQVFSCLCVMVHLDG